MNKQLLNKALKRLSRRAYSEQELKNYLVKFAPTTDELKEVFIKLRSWGYLDDQKLAEEWYEFYLCKEIYGYFYIFKKLQTKGIPLEIIKTTLANYDFELELKRAKVLAEKYWQKDKSLKGREKVARRLYYRGFSEANIRKIITELIIV